MKAKNRGRQTGFTLLEMMVSIAIFLVISTAIFTLLNDSQQRYQVENQMLSSFQEGRLALDQIVRDVNDAGYPAQNQFSSATEPVTNYAATPVAWSPTYPTTACTIGSTCTSPANFDLILEEYNTTAGAVQWIHYQLTGTTLYRGAVSKTAGTDPYTATTATGVMYPYATNVMNNASTAQKTAINAAYPGTFPSGAAVPIFTYTCDDGTNSPVLCSSAGTYNSPANVRDVEVTLIIQLQQADMKTGRLKVVTLDGRGHRVNPNK